MHCVTCSFYNTLVAILFMVNSCNSYNILCLFPYPGKSHHMVFDPLLDELTSREHNITVVSFFPSDNIKPYRRDVSLQGTWPVHKEIVDLKTLELSWFGLEKMFGQIPLVTELANSVLDICERLVDHPALEEFWSGYGDYDLILYEPFISDCMLGIIYQYKLPFIGVLSSELLPYSASRIGMSDNTAYLPDMMSQMTSRMTFIERVQNTIIHHAYLSLYAVMVRPREQKILNRKYPNLPSMNNFSRNMSLLFSNGHHSLTGAKAKVPGLIEVGGLHLKDRVSPLPTEIEQFMNSSTHGVILFSFGSLVRSSTMPDRVKKIFVNVFSRLQQDVIWKWEGDTIPYLPQNVKQVRWVPQYDLLGHPKCVAFISHGGMLGTTEAIYHAKPTLVIPLLGDQFFNAAHIQHSGLGILLQYNQINEHNLEEAINKTLSHSVRESAARASRLWLDRPMKPIDEAMYWIEYIGRHGHNVDLTGQLKHLHFYQSMLIDVYAFLFLVIISALTVIYKVIKLMLYFVPFSSRQKLKTS